MDMTMFICLVLAE